MEVEELKERLEKKVNKEYFDFIEELKTKSPNEIIDYSYEKVVRRELVNVIENGDFSYGEIEAMLNLGKPLQKLYEGTKNEDGLYDILRDCVSETIESVTKEHNQNRSFENREEIGIEE